MIIQIKHNSPIPIYEQLVSEVEKMVQNGELGENDSLPPIRQLASQLDVAVNTVARAYKELEYKGMIISNGRKGTFLRTRIDFTGRNEFKNVILELIRQGYERDQIEQLFFKNIDQIFK